jgi:hypothetical protein
MVGKSTASEMCRGAAGAARAAAAAAAMIAARRIAGAATGREPRPLVRALLDLLNHHRAIGLSTPR